MYDRLSGQDPVPVKRSRPVGPAWTAVAAVGTGLALVSSAALIAVGASRTDALGPALISAGCVGIVLTLLLGPVAFMLAARAARGTSEPDTLRDELKSLSSAIDRMGEQAALSDDARRVLNRQRERELLRRAIEEDISAEAWDAAMILVHELAERFGYRQDAEECRQRIERARAETFQRRVNDAVAQLDGLIIQRRWEAALAEAARIGRLYPDSPRAEGLRQRVEQARSLYKGDLERRFLTAASDGRIDDAMELLKELDHYLLETEAAPYREVARGVIGKARENLGVQFKLAVHDKRWTHAARVGERIIEEFPNSRMAHEVRGIIDSIRSRALDPQSVG